MVIPVPHASIVVTGDVVPPVGAVPMTLVKTAAALLCSLGMTATINAAPQHVHGQHAEQTTEAARAPSQRWTPDAPLRKGMRRAYVAVDAMRPDKNGHMSASMALGRAADVVNAVTYMFAHCKLAAEPDAALHSILAPLLGAAQALKADPQNVQSVAGMRAALAHYPQYFNDPGWVELTPVRHAMHDKP